jgi:hypothetical protein
MWNFGWLGDTYVVVGWPSLICPELFFITETSLQEEAVGFGQTFPGGLFLGLFFMEDLFSSEYLGTVNLLQKYSVTQIQEI